jgi:hypothetical protein
VGLLDPPPLDLTPAQQTALAVLARQAAAHLALQRIAAALAEAVANSKTLHSIVPKIWSVMWYGTIHPFPSLAAACRWVEALHPEAVLTY